MKNDTLQIAFWSLSRQCSIHLTFQRQWQRMALLHGNVWNNWHVLTLTIFFCKRELKWARKPLDSLVRAPKEALWVLMASCSRIIPIPTEPDVSFVWSGGSQHAEAQVHPTVALSAWNDSSGTSTLRVCPSSLAALLGARRHSVSNGKEQSWLAALCSLPPLKSVSENHTAWS